ncbi:hypothetical protein ACFYVL_43990 [Streptomyces sp. NPDC004111]|uniref:hypothetical protein n=1 Tax=Streptomyces sp. NPDC004111 TaxID=3364690 RepID=UPI00367828E9
MTTKAKVKVPAAILDLMAEAVEWSDRYAEEIDQYTCKGRETDECPCGGEDGGCGYSFDLDASDDVDYYFEADAAKTLEVFATIYRHKLRTGRWPEGMDADKTT